MGCREDNGTTKLDEWYLSTQYDVVDGSPLAAARIAWRRARHATPASVARNGTPGQALTRLNPLHEVAEPVLEGIEALIGT